MITVEGHGPINAGRNGGARVSALICTERDIDFSNQPDYWLVHMWETRWFSSKIIRERKAEMGISTDLKEAYRLRCSFQLGGKMVSSTGPCAILLIVLLVMLSADMAAQCRPTSHYGAGMAQDQPIQLEKKGLLQAVPKTEEKNQLQQLASTLRMKVENFEEKTFNSLYNIMSNRSRSKIERRQLSGLGSAPPRCSSKCKSCNPCIAVHVPIKPGAIKLAEYYPEAWRCICGGRLYVP